MEGEDGGRQQVVVMHKATFLATLIGDKGLRATFATQAIREVRLFVNILVNKGFNTVTSTVPDCLIMSSYLRNHKYSSGNSQQVISTESLENFTHTLILSHSLIGPLHSSSGDQNG